MKGCFVKTSNAEDAEEGFLVVSRRCVCKDASQSGDYSTVIIHCVFDRTNGHIFLMS